MGASHDFLYYDLDVFMKSLSPLAPVRDLTYAIKVAFQQAQVKILLLLSFSQISLATVFYHFVEKWSWIDAFYFSVITIATVGYGDFSPQTNLGKLFTVGYILVGIGLFVTTTATLASQMLFAMQSKQTFDLVPTEPFSLQSDQALPPKE